GQSRLRGRRPGLIAAPYSTGWGLDSRRSVHARPGPDAPAGQRGGRQTPQILCDFAPGIACARSAGHVPGPAAIHTLIPLAGFDGLKPLAKKAIMGSATLNVAQGDE